MVKREENNSHISYIGTKGIPAKYGGAETGVEEISSRLLKKEYNLTVFGAHEGKRIKRGFYEGIETIDFPSLKFKGLDFLLRRFLSTIFATIRKDSKILHYYGSDAGLYFFLPKLFRKRIIITLDGFEWERESYSWLEKMFLKTILRVSVKFANHVITDSRFFQKWLKDRYDISSSYVPYAANFNIETDDTVLEEHKLKRREYFIFIGRLVEEKGVDILIKAFSKISTKKNLVIVGDNPYNDDYVDYLKSIASKNVIFLGAIYGKEYEELLKGAYCYVSASKIEGTSPSLVQAMAYGIPSLVSDIPTNIEVLGGTGLTFKNENIKDLSANLVKILNNGILAKNLGEKCSKRAFQNYSWDAVVEKLDKIYMLL